MPMGMPHEAMNTSASTRRERPIVRSFRSDYAERAASHVRLGGHAVVWTRSIGRTGKLQLRAQLVTPVGNPENESDMHLFSVLDLGLQVAPPAARGVFEGLIVTRVPKRAHWVLERRVERDSINEGSTHVVAFDCMQCGACCKDNEVPLERRDRARLRNAGFASSLKAPLARRLDGKLALALVGKDARCVHLAHDNACGVYLARPDACRVFPMGSECCLHARESEFGYYDGLPPELTT